MRCGWNRWDALERCPGWGRISLPGAGERLSQRGWKSGSQLTVMPTPPSQAHQGVLPCAAEAGAAIPEHTEPEPPIHPPQWLLLPCPRARRGGRTAAGATCRIRRSWGDGPWQLLGLRCLPMLLTTAWCCCDAPWLTEQPCFTFHVLAALLSLCPHQVLPGSSTCVFPWENTLFLSDKGKAWDKPSQYSKINRGWEKINVWSSPSVRSVEQIGSWMPHSPFF